MQENTTPITQSADQRGIQYYRDIIVKYIYFALALTTTPLLIIVIADTIKDPNWFFIAFYSLFYLLILSFAFVKSISFSIRAGFLSAVFYLSSLLFLIRGGLSGTGTILIFSFVLLSTLLYNYKVVIVLALLGLSSFAFVGFSMLSGFIAIPPVEILANSDSTAEWIAHIAWFGVLGGILTSSITIVINNFSKNIKTSQNQSDLIQKENDDLLIQLSKIEKELEQKTAQFLTASSLSMDVALETNPQVLYQQTVDQIRDRFNYYHASIFLVDQNKEFAEVVASTGEAGKSLLERKHKLRFGEGVVGYAVKTGKHRLASDVMIDSVHYKNPLLPDTRSEIAIPLLYGDEIIGALDVQSTAENAFANDDIEMLQMIANGIAISSYNAQKIQTLQDEIRLARTQQTGMMKSSWNDFLQAKNKDISLSLKENVVHSNSSKSTYYKEVIKTQSNIIKNAIDNDEVEYSILALPIKIRDQLIGVIDLKLDLPFIPENLLQLADALNARLSIALENARLVEELEARTLQERMIADVSNKVRATTEIDLILKTTAEELGKQLGASEVFIQLDPSVQA